MYIDNRYWAGIFDGEGNIYFAKDLIHMKVAVAQKEVAILYFLRTRFGGRVYKYGVQSTAHWECFNKKDMINFLSAIKPYLIIKRVECEIALEALSGWRPSNHYNKGMNEALPKEEMDRRRLLKEKFDADRSLLKQTSPIT